MRTVSQRQHEVAIAGRVFDEVTGKPIEGADVLIATMPAVVQQKLKFVASAYGKKWEGMPSRTDRTQCRPDGFFYFLDLPDGDYGLRISAPKLGSRCGTAEITATVSRAADGTVKLGFLRCALPPTLVRGKVTGPGQESGVPLARVRVKGSGERAFTDSQGQYVVSGIEPGKKRTLMVSAQGYGTKSKEFALPGPGAAKKVDFDLTRENT